VWRDLLTDLYAGTRGTLPRGLPCVHKGFYLTTPTIPHPPTSGAVDRWYSVDFARGPSDFGIRR